MKNIAIIGAMSEEIEILKNKMIVKNTYNIANMQFLEGNISNKDVILVVCGIGKVNAGACAQILITKFNVGLIINTGVAGAISEELNIGDIVISEDVIQHDFDATGFGYKLGEIPRLDEYIFKGHNKLIELAKDIITNNLNNKVFVGRILSGDIFLANSESKERLLNEFNGHCVDMESAAIGQICYLNKVPFLIFRAISDKADGSAHVNFNEFVNKAAINAANFVEMLLDHI